MESFGLPLIEASQYGCKIIVSKLPFAAAVCEPSMYFDPYSIHEISNAISVSMSEKISESKILIKDRTRDIIEFLTN